MDATVGATGRPRSVSMVGWLESHSIAEPVCKPGFVDGVSGYVEHGRFEQPDRVPRPQKAVQYVEAAEARALLTEPPRRGANTIAWLATLPNDGPSGRFFRDRRAIEW